MLGPKCMVCMMVVSVWGTVFMAIMGIFFLINSALLIEDITLPSTVNVTQPGQEAVWITAVQGQYHQQGVNCFIAAVLYVVTFGGAFIRFRMVKSRL